MLTVGTTAYFDESRIDPSHRVAVVAGFVSTTDMWCEFEKIWNRLLDNKPKKLHWKKYIQGHCVEFARVARDYTAKAISLPVRQAAFKLIRANMRQKGLSLPGRAANLLDSVYAFSCFGCCEQLDNWAHDMRLKKGITPIKVVFDAGGEYETSLRRGYDEFYKDKRNTYLCRVANFDDDNTVVPLQAAHLYAWLTSRAFNNKSSENEALEIIRKDGHATY